MLAEVRIVNSVNWNGVRRQLLWRVTAMIPGMLAACDPASAAVSLSNDVVVVTVYDARTGAWERGAVGELEVGDEVLHDGHLLRVTDESSGLYGATGIDRDDRQGGALAESTEIPERSCIVHRGFDEVGQLSEADATWVVGGVRSIPDGDDWVLVFGHAEDAGHWRLQDLTVGERVVFDEPIGTFVDLEGVATETNVGMIHYAKNGIHIVPAKP